MTPKTKADRIRLLLRDAKEGLTAHQLQERTSFGIEYLRVLLNQMPDTYILRWERTRAGSGYMAVWSVAHVPADAPRPQSVPTDRAEYAAEYRERKRKEKAEAAEAKPEEPTGPKTTWVHVPTWDEHLGVARH